MRFAGFLLEVVAAMVLCGPELMPPSDVALRGGAVELVDVGSCHPVWVVRLGFARASYAAPSCVFLVGGVEAAATPLAEDFVPGLLFRVVGVCSAADDEVCGFWLDGVLAASSRLGEYLSPLPPCCGAVVLPTCGAEGGFLGDGRQQSCADLEARCQGRCGFVGSLATRVGTEIGSAMAVIQRAWIRRLSWRSPSFWTWWWPACFAGVSVGVEFCDVPAAFAVLLCSIAALELAELGAIPESEDSFWDVFSPSCNASCLDSFLAVPV